VYNDNVHDTTRLYIHTVAQLLVNERRAARGLPPYPYAPEVAHTEEVRDLFAAAERLHREQQAAERLVAAVHDHYRSVYGGSAAPLA